MLPITSSLLHVNYRAGRRAPVSAIVLHATEGDAASVISWFNNPAAEVSAHYMVKVSGEIVQFVHEQDEAWAQGRVDHPTAQVVRDNPTVNPNAYCVAVEHEITTHADITGPQRAASIALVQDIAQRNGLPINRTTVLGHHEIYSLKTCPDGIDVDRYVAEASGAADYPRVVYSPSVGDYLVVTRYISDTEWYFTPLRTLAGGSRAGTPLSAMPTAP